MGPKKRRKLTGAAKTAGEAKLARDEVRKDPIGFELGKLAAAAASASGGTLEEAMSRVEEYSRRNEKDDETPDILRGCLREFPPEGRGNLIRDVLARDDDDAELGRLAGDLKRWLFYPGK